HPRLPRPGLLLASQQGHRTIAAAVIDEDALIRHLETIEGGIEPAEQRRQRSLLVENGHDDAQGGAGSLHGGRILQRLTCARRERNLGSMKTREHHLELARLADAPMIAGMSSRLIEAGLTPSWPAERVARHIRNPDSVVLTSRHSGR